MNGEGWGGQNPSRGRYGNNRRGDNPRGRGVHIDRWQNPSGTAEWGPEKAANSVDDERTRNLHNPDNSGWGTLPAQEHNVDVGQWTSDNRWHGEQQQQHHQQQQQQPPRSQQQQYDPYWGQDGQNVDAAKNNWEQQPPPPQHRPEAANKGWTPNGQPMAEAYVHTAAATQHLQHNNAQYLAAAAQQQELSKEWQQQQQHRYNQQMYPPPPQWQSVQDSQYDVHLAAQLYSLHVDPNVALNMAAAAAQAESSQSNDSLLRQQPPQSPVDSIWGSAIPTEHLPSSKDRGRPILGGVDVTSQMMGGFQLSATAREFVPRAQQHEAVYAPPPPSNYYDNRHVAAAANYHEEQIPQAPEFNAPTALENVQRAIAHLTANPEAITTVTPLLVKALDDTIKDEATLVKVVHEVFRKAQAESNFRYTGAKLCERLVHDLKVEYPSGNFRQLLLKKCHEEHLTRAEDIKNIGKRATVIGFALFMGELFVNITIGENEDRLHVLSTAIMEMLLTLLAEGDEGCLRCVVQLLKLAGSTIEELEKAKKKAAGDPKAEESTFEVIFQQLKDIAVNEAKSRRIRTMVLSVLELRASEWGQISPSTTGAATTAPPPPKPVEEEKNLEEFIIEGGEPCALDPDGDPDTVLDENGEPVFIEPTVDDDPEMTDEIADAYEDFLQANKK